jgi:hypothetical protein
MTFSEWLRQQTHRDDPVGDLSRDALSDKRRKGSTLNWWLKHLKQRGACDGAFKALEQAWQDYATSLECDDREPYA